MWEGSVTARTRYRARVSLGREACAWVCARVIAAHQLYSPRRPAIRLASTFLAFAVASPAAATNLESRSPVLERSCPVVVPELNKPASLEPSTAPMTPKQRDSSCYIAGDSAQASIDRGRAVLVDIRSAEAFQRHHVPGSLNMPLHAIRTKAFLRSNPVILLDDGLSAETLEGACADLRRNGFAQVNVLRGGIRVWAEQGRPVIGDRLAIAELKWLSPNALFVERRYDDWLVLDFSQKHDPVALKWLPRNVERINAARPNATAIVKKAVEHKAKNRPWLNVLVVNDDGEGYDKLGSLMRKAGIKHEAYLTGGIRGYRDFLSNQVAMWDRKSQSSRVPACRS